MTLIVEGALVVTMLCTSDKRRSGQEPYYLLSNDSTKCFQLATGASLEKELATEIEALSGVRAVRVMRTKNVFSIDISMESFDKVSRRKIYAKEREFYRKFPKYGFDFCLIDQSGTTGNAFAG